ncbi:MAG: hypothetical protein IPK20_02385 [Betaproteobacteria bacterium]|nr:hypothetical protein [Betaproteobacteria bacterium]
MSEPKMINLEVDGQAVQVPEGSTVMEGRRESPRGLRQQDERRRSPTVLRQGGGRPVSEPKMINLEVDGQAVQVPEGSTVMEGRRESPSRGPSGDASKTSGVGRRQCCGMAEGGL